jgi:hypothetical protein
MRAPLELSEFSSGQAWAGKNLENVGRFLIIRCDVCEVRDA